MKRTKRHALPIIIGMVAALGTFAAGYFLLPYALSSEYVTGIAEKAVSSQGDTTRTSDVQKAAGASHIPVPEQVKGIYMSQCAAGTPSFRKAFFDMLDTTELNAVVIDVKDSTGGIAFPTDDPQLAPYVSPTCTVSDMREFVAALHAKGVYVIARLTVFQDPMYAKKHPELAVKTKAGATWKNYSGLAFVDVGAKPFWDYIVHLAHVSYGEYGFDEINFDYIRYPSDGPVADADFTWSRGKTKSEALEEFFQYLHGKLEPAGITTSADLFGYVTVQTDDLGIGQLLERTLPYFDYLCPMVYPSHYNKGFMGLTNVNSDPYKVVYASMASAVARAGAATTSVYAFGETLIASTSPKAYTKPVFPKDKLRPWLQSFDYPVPYTPAMVQAQIKATSDAGLDSWLFWDAGNKYASLRRTLPASETSR